jgi:hypothetical protein
MGEILSWSCPFGVLKASCNWMVISFPRFGKCSTITLLYVSSAFACTSSPYSMPIINNWSFNSVPEAFPVPFIFLHSFFFTLIWFFCYIYLVFMSNILSSIWSSLLQKLSAESFIWFVKLYICGISIWFFSRFLYLYWCHLPYLAISSFFGSAFYLHPLWIYLVFIFFTFIEVLIHVLFNFINYSYHHSFEFNIDISPNLLSFFVSALRFTNLKSSHWLEILIF